MAGDWRAVAQDHHPVDETLHQHRLEPMRRRHRVVVAAVADQGGGGYPGADGLAGLQRHGRQGPQRRQIRRQPRADRLGMPASPVGLPQAAALHQHGVERIVAGSHWHRGHEVGAGELHQPLDLALVVALAGAAKPILEQIVADQTGKCPGPLAPAVAADPGHRQLEVVVEDRPRHAAKEGEGRCVAVEEASVVSRG